MGANPAKIYVRKSALSTPICHLSEWQRRRTTKVFEDDETIVLIFVAHLTGSTETFYLNKKRNRFTLIEVGALEATATGADFRPKVTYGTLKKTLLLNLAL